VGGNILSEAIFLLGIRTPEVHELRKRISVCLIGQCRGIVHGSRMAIDSPTNYRLVFNFKSKPIDFNNVGMPRYPQQA